MTAFPDPTTDFGRRVADRLDSATVIWLTTVGTGGVPQPNPVWFVREGDDVLVYNAVDAARLPALRERPKVALNLDGDGEGGDIVVLLGTAHLVEPAAPAHESEAFVAKYGERMTALFGTVAGFSTRYPWLARIEIERVPGH